MKGEWKWKVWRVVRGGQRSRWPGLDLPARRHYRFRINLSLLRLHVSSPPHPSPFAPSELTRASMRPEGASLSLSLRQKRAESPKEMTLTGRRGKISSLTVEERSGDDPRVTFTRRKKRGNDCI